MGTTVEGKKVIHNCVIYLEWGPCCMCAGLIRQHFCVDLLPTDQTCARLVRLNITLLGKQSWERAGVVFSVCSSLGSQSADASTYEKRAATYSEKSDKHASGVFYQCVCASS